jgi:hypothetical protein
MEGMDGMVGPDGPAGMNGMDGSDGTDGADGSDGVACWDLNANGACDIPAEDPNDDAACDVLDCEGGDGVACWDLNANDTCDTAEDANSDTVCDVQDCAGAQGPAGPTGPQGAENILQVLRFFGGVSSTIASGSSLYLFQGPTVTMTIASGQQFVGTASAVLATTAGVANFVDVGLCYQQGTGTVTNFAPFLTAEIDTTATPVAVSAASPTNLTGTFTVGYCVRNGGATAINSNDWVSGWVSVVNP